MKEKVTKSILIILGFLLWLLEFCIVVAIGAFAFMKMTNRKIIVKEDESFEILQNVTEKDLLNYFAEPTITIIDNDTKEETVSKYSDFGIIRIVENYEEIEDALFVKLEEIEDRITYDDSNETINECISKYNRNRVDFTYPTLAVKDDGFYVTEEITGKKLDTSEVYTQIYDSIGDNITIYTDDVLVERDNNNPTVDALNQEIDKINNSYIIYKNGFKISATDFANYYVIENNQIILDEELKSDFKEAVDRVIDIELAEYDTVGKGFEFITTGGETITVKGGTWGNIFSSDKESDYIVGILGSFQSEVDREPIYSQEFPSVIDRYVEISLEQQHLWFYDKGELVMESDIVTGTANSSRETPEGVYFISEMIPGKNLSGRDYVTWVNRWMRITWRGHGLHDAYWRDAFGGNIYQYAGSHGCINLPKDFAYKLYEQLKVKDCVVIY